MITRNGAPIMPRYGINGPRERFRGKRVQFGYGTAAVRIQLSACSLWKLGAASNGLACIRAEKEAEKRMERKINRNGYKTGTDRGEGTRPRDERKYTGCFIIDRAFQKRLIPRGGKWTECTAGSFIFSSFPFFLRVGWKIHRVDAAARRSLNV